MPTTTPAAWGPDGGAGGAWTGGEILLGLEAIAEKEERRTTGGERCPRHTRVAPGTRQWRTRRPSQARGGARGTPRGGFS